MKNIFKITIIIFLIVNHISCFSKDKVNQSKQNSIIAFSTLSMDEKRKYSKSAMSFYYPQSGNISFSNSLINCKSEEIIVNWHPYERKILIGCGSNNNSNIKILNFPTNQEQQVDIKAKYACWSSDGKSIIYIPENDFVSNINTNTINIYNISTKKIVKLIDIKGKSFSFLSSAHNKLISECIIGSGKLPIEGIVQIDLITKKHEVLYSLEGFICDLQISPDGEKIAFSHTTFGLVDLYIFDIKNKKINKILDTVKTLGNNRPVNLSWSPDSNEICYISLTNDDEFALNIFDISNRKNKIIYTTSNNENKFPELIIQTSWSPLYP